MRKIRFLIMMAAMLLSCGIANAQGVEATDGQTTTLKGDLNSDGKVNAADVTVLVGIIMETDYFLLGSDAAVPNKSNYTFLDGVVTNYNSIDDVLGKNQTISLAAGQKGILLCPNDWEVKDLVLQNETGTIYALTVTETDIPGYILFQTDAVAAAATYTLKTKTAADAYKISITDYFYLGTVEPTKDNFTTIDGVVTDYNALANILDAAPTVKVAAGKAAILLCPSSWEAKDLVLQNEEDGNFYDLAAAETDINDYALFQTEVIAEEVTLKLKNKTEAEAYQESLNHKDSQYFWLGNTYPTKNNFPMMSGTEVDGLFTTYTSLSEAMDKASRDYSAGEYVVVLYPLSWGAKDDLVFLDSANKKYYVTKQKTVSDFPDYLYYESTEKIGANTTIKLSTKTDAEKAGATLYEKVTPVNPVDPVDPVDPVVVPGQAEYVGGNGITFVIVNNCGYEARFTGKAKINLSKNPNSWAEFKEVDANFHGPQSGTSWDRNDIIIGVGERKTLTIPSISYVSSVTNKVSHIESKYQNADFADGTWYFMNSDCDYNQYIHSIYLYTRMYSKSRGETGGSNHMYTVVPLKNTKLQRGYKYYLSLNWKNPEASLAPDTSGSKYIILEKNKTGL